jgi:poly(U)-specific endoribonuclease
LPSIASALPTPFPTQHTTTTVKPGKDQPKLPSIAAALPQPGLPKQDTIVSTTTVRPTPKVKEDFPKLSESPTPAPPKVLSSTVANAWLNTPTTRTTEGPRVAFVPTQKPQSRPGSPQPAPVSGPITDSSDNEIMQLSEQLFTKDTNNPYKYVTVDYQSRTWAGGKDDEAPNPLLKVDEAKVFEIPTIKKMRPLFNNYEVDATVHEYVSPNEKQEEDEFIDALLQTQVMKTAMTFLQQKGVVTTNPQSHKDLLKTVWFTIYSRGQGKQGSSGFEHVFLNELKNSTILGLHNWVYYYEMEKAGMVNYQGYMKKVELGSVSTGQLFILIFYPF